MDFINNPFRLCSSNINYTLTFIIKELEIAWIPYKHSTSSSPSILTQNVVSFFVDDYLRCVRNFSSFRIYLYEFVIVKLSEAIGSGFVVGVVEIINKAIFKRSFLFLNFICSELKLKKKQNKS